MITSRDNERLKLVRKLESRRWRGKLGLLVAEGEDLVAAALDAGLEPVFTLVDAERPPLLGGLEAAEPVEPRLLAEASTLAHPPRVLAVFARAALPGGSRSATLALWRVADPGNVGTLVRAADAFGAGVALSAACADPTSQKALRASAGAIFRVPIGRFDDASGPRVALVARGGTPLPELELARPLAFVLGAEREGLPSDVVDACAAVATIPQPGASESLNVAMAGTVALYELSRRSA